MAPWEPAQLAWSPTSNSTAQLTWSSGGTAKNFTTAGNPAAFSTGQAVIFNDPPTGTFAYSVTVAAAGVTPGGSVIFNNQANPTHPYSIYGGPIAGNATVEIAGGKSVNFYNSNTYYGATQVSNLSTLALYSTGSNMGLNSESTMDLEDNSKLVFNQSGSFANTFYFIPGSAGVGASPQINVGSGKNVVLTGPLNSTLIGATEIGFTKTGAGQLTLTDANDEGISYNCIVNVSQGTICVQNVVAAAGQSFSPLGAANINIGTATGGAGALYLANVQIGVNQNQTTTNQVGYMDLYTASALVASGNSSFEHASVSAVLNSAAESGVYNPASGTLATTGPSDTLTLNNELHQYDPSYPTNNYGTWNGNGQSGSVDANKLFTMHVAGGGVVRLSDGGVSGDTVFGGAMVDRQRRPPSRPHAGVFQRYHKQYGDRLDGALGQPLNALGFHTPDGQVYPGVHGDPDLPNAVTVNAGGILAVAVDQVNVNPNISTTAVNSTPTYLRNPITLAGGAIASTGYEVTFTAANGTNGAGQPVANGVPEGMPNGTEVIAQFGGSLTINAGTSQVLTYDPVGNTGSGRWTWSAARAISPTPAPAGRPAARSSTRRAGWARCR